MDSILRDIKNRKRFHHAHLVIGDTKQVLNDLNSSIEAVFNISINGNPDYFLLKTEVFDIEDSRRLRSASQKISVTGDVRFFVVTAESFLEKAQNALLKTLEEPVSGNYFFVIVSDEWQLLPTVRSRLNKVPQKDNFEKEEALVSLIKDFLSSNYAERIILIDKIIGTNLEPSEQRILVKKFISSLQKYLFDLYKNGKRKFSTDEIESLSLISSIIEYAGDVSSAHKLLLEYTSFICPSIKNTKDEKNIL